MADAPTPPNDSGRRFSDQEVALVLQRATEIEEKRPGPSAGRGLSLRELHEIAREVGLSPDVIDEAVRAVQTGRQSPTRSLLGAPLTTKLVRAFPTALQNDAMQRVVRVLDDRVDTAGTVTEALGTVRWTSADRSNGLGRSTQVSLTVQGDETQVHVVQRHPGRLRTALHLMPAMWGLMIAGPIAASASLNALSGIGLILAGAGAGLGIGHGIWQLLARRRTRDTEELADAIATAASP